ncbi:MAG: hypothetical protein ACLRVT_00160 [Oscillospiraceae bacterium]
MAKWDTSESLPKALKDAGSISWRIPAVPTSSGIFCYMKSFHRRIPARR